MNIEIINAKVMAEIISALPGDDTAEKQYLMSIIPLLVARS
jgi:hypothetical protein